MQTPPLPSPTLCSPIIHTENRNSSGRNLRPSSNPAGFTHTYIHQLKKTTSSKKRKKKKEKNSSAVITDTTGHELVAVHYTFQQLTGMNDVSAEGHCCMYVSNTNVSFMPRRYVNKNRFRCVFCQLTVH